MAPDGHDPQAVRVSPNTPFLLFLCNAKCVRVMYNEDRLLLHALIVMRGALYLACTSGLPPSDLLLRISSVPSALVLGVEVLWLGVPLEPFAQQTLPLV